ncbi:MAG: quinone oxidoreductase [Thermoanaerobaculaceae bacterium]|nr:quinone oxidoreductase [Thermoanaerobaculaceae bacterium]
MAKAIRIHATGGPEVLRWEEVEVGHPGPGEALVRQTAIGLNYLDTYHRSGLYPLQLPAVIGSEAAGVVEEIGPSVAEVKPGERVAYAGVVGAYAEMRLIRAERLVTLPPAIDDRTAAAAMLKGMTAQYLLRRTCPVAAGDAVLIHAAAGGVGLILCQWAKQLGAVVIGTVSTEAKAKLARAHGCEFPIVTTREDFVARVRAITGGRGVRVVYDSVGRDTWDGSLDCLQPLGMMVTYGNSSGPVPAFSPLVLSAKGSIFLTRPTLMTYVARRSDLLATAAELFDVIDSGAVRIEINQTYPLAEAERAHRDLEARRTTGSTVLLP